MASKEEKLKEYLESMDEDEVVPLNACLEQAEDRGDVEECIREDRLQYKATFDEFGRIKDIRIPNSRLEGKDLVWKRTAEDGELFVPQ